MKTENSNTAAPLRTALLLALALSGAALVSGCNKPVEEPPVPTDAAPPPSETPATETPPPADSMPPAAPAGQDPAAVPADEPAATPAPADSDKPPGG